MSRKRTRFTVGGSQTGTFVVADSIVELEIKDMTAIQSHDGAMHFTTDKIGLMDFSDATWILYFGAKTDTEFLVVFHDFPPELKGKSQAELFVSFGAEKIKANFRFSSVSESRICFGTTNLTKYSVNNEITLNCRLVITCECDSKIQSKFYDPLDARKSLIKDISDMFGDPTFADFTFIVGSREYKVHMNILAAASPVMRRMFTADLEEAKTKKCTVDAIDPEIFAYMLRFIYNADIPENLKAVAMPLYEAAHYYDIKNLKRICAQEIHGILSPDNALEVFEWAQPYDLKDLKTDAWTIIKRDILKMYVELKDEPLPLAKIKAIVNQREQEARFWEEIEEEVVKKAKK